MAKHEKISEERRKLIKEFINQNNITTAKGIEEALKNMFKDTLQEMLEAEMTTQLGFNILMRQNKIIEMDMEQKISILVQEILR